MTEKWGFKGRKQSHPSRVCGLKFQDLIALDLVGVSHPSRVCGLKSSGPVNIENGIGVTPFTGVWIEIGIHRDPAEHRTSHPSRVCGLK